MGSSVQEKNFSIFISWTAIDATSTWTWMNFNQDVQTECVNDIAHGLLDFPALVFTFMLSRALTRWNKLLEEIVNGNRWNYSRRNWTHGDCPCSLKFPSNPSRHVLSRTCSTLPYRTRASFLKYPSFVVLSAHWRITLPVYNVDVVDMCCLSSLLKIGEYNNLIKEIRYP